MVKKIVQVEIEVNEEFGNMLIAAREALDETQISIATQCGVSRQCYERWERGRRVPSVDKCERIAEVLKIDLRKILELTHPDILKLAKKLGKG